MNLTLYQIADKHQEALNFMLDNDVDYQTMADTLESIESELTTKGQSVAALFLNLDAQIDAMKSAENKISERRKRLQKKSDDMKQYLLTNMERCGIDKITAPEFEVKLHKCPPSVDENIDMDLLPKQYIQEVTEKKVLKYLIRNDLLAGIPVAGAKLITGKKTLKIE